MQARQGLPLGNQVLGWSVLGEQTEFCSELEGSRLTKAVLSFLMPFAHRIHPNNNYMHRLMMMFLTCAPSFVILTVSYEGLFYVAYCILLLTWLRLEKAAQTSVKANAKAAPQALLRDGVYRPLQLSDGRVALFFMVLLQSAFFSTGNVASVSSFSLESVNRLMPVFDPFSQGALLILKLMIPFALISANLGVLNIRLRVPPSALFMLVMAVSDILTMYFFWVVKDEGSWLEIGSTISHFVIASLLCVFVAGLEVVSGYFIAGITVEEDDKAGVTVSGKKSENGHGKKQQ